jgi:hypothetical protein
MEFEAEQVNCYEENSSGNVRVILEVERALGARAAGVELHRLGSHSKRPGNADGAASLMHRAAVESNVRWGVLKRPTKNGVLKMRVQRERRVQRVQRVQRLQRAARSRAHAPRPTPSAAPSHARRSTLCTLTDQLLLSAGHRCETVSRPKVLPFLR